MYYIIMKGGYIVNKSEGKQFLRICKNVDCIKFNSILKNNNISQPAISKFINSDDYDDFISITKLDKLCNELYNSCMFVTDMYREIVLHEKIA